MGKQRDAQNRRTTARRDESSGGKRGYIIVGAVVAVFLIGFIALVVIDSRQRSAGGPPGGVEDVDVGPASQHTEGPVNYDQTPPAGGEHNPQWQNAGFYSDPIPNETAVHTLEHGAVWITYQPDLPQDQIDEIRNLVEGEPCMLASPFDGLPSPVVASAWGKQLQLESASDPELGEFIRAYQQGPQTPEPGALCTNGVGEPS